jgi:hypothetical protein
MTMPDKVACAVLVVAALVLADAGCGTDHGSRETGGAAQQGTDGAAQRETNDAALRPKDMVLVRKTLLRASDLPSGWGAGAASQRERCREGDLFRDVTGRATSGSFRRGNVDIEQSVWFFRDADAAREAFATMAAPRGLACFRLRVEARVLEQDSSFVTPLRRTQETGGKGTRRSRLAATISSAVNSPLGPLQTTMALKVYVFEHRAGRGVSSVVVIGAAERPDPATVRALTRIASRRLGATLAGAGS